MIASIEVIGIDHGWSMIKTESCVFATGVKEIPNEPPMRNDILEYQGRFYTIGERRLEVRTEKTAFLEYLGKNKEELYRYADGVYNSLREYKISLKTAKIVFVGGGAVVMKNFGNLQQRNISYVVDVKANAPHA